tara:strand:+ start:277 stop:567 length:291 start_codon:yes stop_codon:yes gene_type:complete
VQQTNKRTKTNIMNHFQIGAKLNKTEEIKMATQIAKDMILHSIKCGELPSLKKLQDFSHIHDFVDANEYLLGTRFNFSIDDYNTISNSLDLWIKKN